MSHPPLDPAQEAYIIWWHRHYPHQEADLRLDPFLTDAAKGFNATETGWLRTARRALFRSTGEVARRLQVSRSSYAELETKESRGEITLRTLAKTAEALDCELVYALRPKTKVRFSEVIWGQLVPPSLRHRFVRNSSAPTKARALAAVARIHMQDPDFRRDRGWIRRDV